MVRKVLWEPVYKAENTTSVEVTSTIVYDHKCNEWICKLKYLRIWKFHAVKQMQDVTQEQEETKISHIRNKLSGKHLIKIWDIE